MQDHLDEAPIDRRTGRLRSGEAEKGGKCTDRSEMHVGLIDGSTGFVCVVWP